MVISGRCGPGCGSPPCAAQMVTRAGGGRRVRRLVRSVLARKCTVGREEMSGRESQWPAPLVTLRRIRMRLSHV